MNSSGDRQDFNLLLECCNTAREWYCNFAFNKQSRTQWQKDIEYSLKFGFTGSVQTNDILKNLANLGRIFYGMDTVPDLAKFIHERVVELPGYVDTAVIKMRFKKRKIGSIKLFCWQASSRSNCSFRTEFHLPVIAIK